jgi:hypothetical protein
MDRRSLIRFLREQAARCYRAAEHITDRKFADDLVKVARELEDEADQIERTGVGDRIAGGRVTPPGSS